MAEHTWHRHLEASTLAESDLSLEMADLTVPGLTILCHPDLSRVGEVALLTPLGSGRSVAVSRLEPMFLSQQSPVPRPLADPHLSRQPFELQPSQRGAVSLVGSGGRVGVDPVTERQGDSLVFSAEQVENGVLLTLSQRVVLLFHPVLPAPPQRLPRFGLVGDSRSMVHLRREIEQVADLDVPVLLRGETGTGKELVAQAIHDGSSRRSRPYLSVNMSGIPPTLAAAELFGSAKGAFTGADSRRQGYFAQAHGGTLFLDEIGDCPSDVQALLLRVLETGEIQPVGAERPRKVDVRVVAATDADLETAIDEGRFRAPLLHRLNSYQVKLPPLRQRRDDLGRLFVHFLRQELAALGEMHKTEPGDPRQPTWLPAKLVARMAACDWPGNVRQLRNLARHVVIAQRGEANIVIDSRVEEMLAAAALSPEGGAVSAAPPPAPKKVYRAPTEVSDEELEQALESCKWELKAAASTLGVSRTSLYALIERNPNIRTAAQLAESEIQEALKANDGDSAKAAQRLKVSQQALLRRIRELKL